MKQKERDMIEMHYKQMQEMYGKLQNIWLNHGKNMEKTAVLLAVRLFYLDLISSVPVRYQEQLEMIMDEYIEIMEEEGKIKRGE